jgi:hypothetical protein
VQPSTYLRTLGAEARPPEVTLDEFFHLKMARVTRNGVIMESAEEVVSGRRRDVGMALGLHDLILLFSSNLNINNIQILYCVI